MNRCRQPHCRITLRRCSPQPSITLQVAPATVRMLFLFNLIYAATWGTVAFLIPTEIFPSTMRAQGNGFGITGWAIGVGWTVLVNPIMFQHLESRTFFLFAGLNLIWMPIVFFSIPKLQIVHLNRSMQCLARRAHCTALWRRLTEMLGMVVFLHIDG